MLNLQTTPLPPWTALLAATPGAPGIAEAARVLGTVAVGSVAWFFYFNYKDRKSPEPRRIVLFAFVMGAVAAGAAIGIFNFLSLVGAPVDASGTPAEIAFTCFAVAGPVEEGVKFIVARTTVFRSHHYDEELDGLVYASAVALGFAAVENLLYIRDQDWRAGAARALASPLSHSLFSAVWGLGAARAHFNNYGPRKRFAMESGSLVCAMAAHGLYDYSLFALDSPAASGAVVLVLWILVLARVKRLTHNPKGA